MSAGVTALPGATESTNSIGRYRRVTPASIGQGRVVITGTVFYPSFGRSNQVEILETGSTLRTSTNDQADRRVPNFPSSTE